MKPLWILLVTASAAFVAPAQAHGDKEPASKNTATRKEQKAWGIAGDRKAVKRTIELAMGDNMRFTPDRIEVKEGETIKFVIKNTGKLMHEMVIGTKKELDVHAALMAKFPNMEHDEPYQAHVGAGKAGEMIWKFNRTGDFDFACLIAGHYQSGMVGTIKVLGHSKHDGRDQAQKH